jgi:hypothetical protein
MKLFLPVVALFWGVPPLLFAAHLTPREFVAFFVSRAIMIPRVADCLPKEVTLLNLPG